MDALFHSSLAIHFYRPILSVQSEMKLRNFNIYSTVRGVKNKVALIFVEIEIMAIPSVFAEISLKLFQEKHVLNVIPFL